MENVLSETTEEPVLLSWEMPAEERTFSRKLAQRISVVFFAIIFVVALIGSLMEDMTWKVHVTVWLVVATIAIPLIPWLIRLVLQSSSVVSLDCTSSGILVTMPDWEKRHVAWHEIKVLAKYGKGFTMLRYGRLARQRLYLPIPSDVRDKLIAILRETSNARIVGFGTEES